MAGVIVEIELLEASHQLMGTLVHLAIHKQVEVVLMVAVAVLEL